MQVISREHIALNFWPAVVSAVLVIAGISAKTALDADRAPPVEFIEGTILPSLVIAGQRAQVRWNVDWKRQCSGLVSRELYDAEHQVRRYKPFIPPVPVQLGSQSVINEFWAFSSLPAGETKYRAIIRFTNCGFTSRWWPIELRVPDLTFQVMRAK